MNKTLLWDVTLGWHHQKDTLHAMDGSGPYDLSNGGVLAGRHDRRFVGPEPRLVERLHHPALEALLRGHRALGVPALDALESGQRDLLQETSGPAVVVQLGGGPPGGQSGHQLGRRDDVGPGGTEQLDHAGGDTIEIRDRVPRRVLDGEPLAGNQPRQLLLQLADLRADGRLRPEAGLGGFGEALQPNDLEEGVELVKVHMTCRRGYSSEL
jgi:hypothetical protein